MSLRVKKTGQRFSASRLNNMALQAWRAYANDQFHPVKWVPVKRKHPRTEYITLA